MSAYRHSEDGAEMVEWKPGFTVRRDVGLRLGLIAPEIGIGRARPMALAPVSDPRPDPVEPPPLQPSHEDLVSIAPEPVATPDLPLWVEPATAVVAVAKPVRPRPAKRSLADILAEADRGYRALRRKAKA